MALLQSEGMENRYRENIVLIYRVNTLQRQTFSNGFFFFFFEIFEVYSLPVSIFTLTVCVFKYLSSAARRSKSVCVLWPIKKKGEKKKTI